MMRFVNHHHAPKIGAQLRDELAAVNRLDGGTQVLIAVGYIRTIEQGAKGRVTQDLPKRRHRLLQDLGLMSDKCIPDYLFDETSEMKRYLEDIILDETK